jgi:hypothetical protein
MNFIVASFVERGRTSLVLALVAAVARHRRVPTCIGAENLHVDAGA